MGAAQLVCARRTEAGRRYSFDRQNWFGCHQAEHCAARETVMVFDQTLVFPVHLQGGRDVVPILQRLYWQRCGCAGWPRAVYTGMFNERGGFESDLTAIRLAVDEYLLISGTAQTVRDFDWISRNLRPEENVSLMTGYYARQFNHRCNGALFARCLGA